MFDGSDHPPELTDAIAALADRIDSARPSPLAAVLSKNLRMLNTYNYKGDRLAHEWMRIRGSLFADAWWFRRSAADSVAPVHPPPSG